MQHVEIGSSSVQVRPHLIAVPAYAALVWLVQLHLKHTKSVVRHLACRLYVDEPGTLIASSCGYTSGDPVISVLSSIEPNGPDFTCEG